MGGAPVVVFLESEFNKGGIERYEPFDGYMAAMDRWTFHLVEKHPDADAPWRAGAMEIWELPIGVSPVLRLPLIGTNLLLLAPGLRLRCRFFWLPDLFQ